MWFKSSYSDDQGGNCLEVALEWRKSSYSDSQGSNCLEVALEWRKSSYSDSEGSNCLEVAACPTLIHIRDSKLGSQSPSFSAAAPAWNAFLAHARSAAPSASRRATRTA
ncbi:DUF397 domain-containing protein [Streptomyces sp. SID8379]|nr:DUF397 domain-containing protein [Streptomyces sp. SID8379]MYW68409.1 DUF397 domain-containing protein [Streptomyces sp. SID8379]